MNTPTTSKNAPSLHEAIARHPFAKGLVPAHISVLSRCATFVQLASGQIVFRELDDANRFFLILDGRISLEAFVPNRGRVVVQTLGAGEPLGCSWLFPPYHFQFTATTAEPSELIALDAAQLREQVKHDRDFGCELYSRVAGMLAHRLQATRRRLIRFYDPTEQNLDSLAPFE